MLNIDLQSIRRVPTNPTQTYMAVNTCMELNRPSYNNSSSIHSQSIRQIAFKQTLTYGHQPTLCLCTQIQDMPFSHKVSDGSSSHKLQCRWTQLLTFDKLYNSPYIYMTMWMGIVAYLVNLLCKYSVNSVLSLCINYFMKIFFSIISNNLLIILKCNLNQVFKCQVI